MKRRSFLKLTGTAGIVTLITPTSIIHTVRGAHESALEESFKNPPASARPYTWWHWMNGNITKQGITLDLEAMQRVGIGGVQCFNVGSGIPKGPVDYLGAEWVELTRHALREAGRLGLEFDMHNCPGWSSTGGPWITPEISMQQMVWSETFVTGEKELNVLLPKPFSKLDHYRDTYVLAFPSLKGETEPILNLVKNVSANGETVDVNLSFRADLSGGVKIAPANSNQPGNLLFEFAEPFEARSVAVFSTIITGAPSVTGGGPSSNQFILESSPDGKIFSKVSDFRRIGNNVEMQTTVATFNLVSAKYFRLLVPQQLLIADVRLSTSPRIINWPAKANFPGAGGSGSAGNSLASSHTPVFFEINKESIIDPTTVLDLTNLLDKNGQLQWQAPPGNWTILRMGHTAIGRRNNAAPESGAGLESDKYSRKAYDFHFNKMFENLLPDMKQLIAKGKVGLLVDSYEVGMQNWTPDLPEEFKKRRGYDFVKYLPAMTGRVVGSVDTAERFLWDLRRTHADLMADNYHGYFAELCKKHGFLAYTEPYNNGPFEQMQVGSKVHINMGEFWIRGPHFFPSVKLASSIAHIYGQRVDGKQIVAAESFTGDTVHSKWQESPFAMKGQGDLMFTKGLNRFIFHRYAHQPHPTAVPGMTMGPWGFHFDRTNTWFEKGKKWLEYASRCQGVLQLGNFVGDILYYTGDDGPGDDFSMMHTPDPAPPKGYDYDFINKEAILTRVNIQKGRITLADKGSYRLIVLPDRKTMTIETLRKLAELVKNGMVLSGPPPVQTPGLSVGSDDGELESLTYEIWGDLNNGSITERKVGQGKVFFGASLQNVLDRMNIKPDFEFSATNDAPINYIHRTIGNSEVYFVANRWRKKEEVLATFRVAGKKPELWNADTGEMITVDVYDLGEGRTKVPLQFDPYGSFFVVFRSPAVLKYLKTIEKEGTEIVSTKNFPSHKVGKYPDVTNNFTITAWLKPETEENFNSAFALNRGLASNVFYPPEGELVYGQNHVACGLIAARNGLMVYERAIGTPSIVLVAPMPLSGWTHVALVYNSGTPVVYVNGQLLKEGNASGRVVHPGLSEAIQDNLSWFFEGDMSEPELFREVLNEDRIRQIFDKGAPLPEETLPVQLKAGEKGGLLFWQNGKYTLQNNLGQKTSLQISGIAKSTELTASWTVNFPPASGAPDQVTLHKLSSLHKHREDRVKYFSGTATYTNRFNVPASSLGGNKRLFLDLGRVEVLAEIKLNGKPLGILWKPPFRVDISNEVKTGENSLEVQVTNLWPNRLIGDEQLPPENEYGNVGGGGVGSVVSGGGIRKLPDWYVQGKPKPAGGRITFTTWRHYNKDSPLLESGLIGPVLLRSARFHKVKY